MRRPAGVSRLAFLARRVTTVPLRFAHRALAAADIFARAAADIRRLPPRLTDVAPESSNIEVNCFSSCSIFRLSETALSKLLSDSCIDPVGSAQGGLARRNCSATVSIALGVQGEISIRWGRR